MAVGRKPSTLPIKPGSIVARRGGRPARLLKGGSQLSSRQERKAALANYFDSKAERRKQTVQQAILGTLNSNQ